MQPKTLRVRAKGDLLVQDHQRLALGVNAFVGRVYRELDDQPGVWGFASTGEAAVVPASAEYMKALRDGDLEAADDETAKAAGVQFAEPRNALHDLKDGDK